MNPKNVVWHGEFDDHADQSAVLDTDPHPHPLPWTVFAGTIINDANGNVVLCAAEEAEGRGGNFWGIRDALRRCGSQGDQTLTL